MDAELKAKWVAALRSGRYRQTVSTLERLDEAGEVVGNCCLGVLCREAGVPETDSFRGSGGYVTFDGRGGWLSPRLLERFDITGPEQDQLATMNDSGNYDFDQIADYIEKEL